jgi:Flp pilus assembly protein TadG
VTLPTSRPVALRRLRAEQGQSLVELVLGLPLLLLVLVAILQFGLAMHDYVEVTQAARAGARKASVSRKANPAAAALAAARSSATGLDEDQLGVNVTPSGEVRRGDPVAVEVSYPYEVDVLGLVLQSGTMTFRATARMQ